MSLLTIVQDSCDALGVDSPTSVIGNTDADIVQLLQLSQLEGKALADEYDWDALILEATFTTVAAEIQGDVATLAPGFKKFINDTQWNRDLRWRVQGSMSPQRYQSLKSFGVATPYPDYRVRGKSFVLYPAPAAGQEMAFEYITKNWIQSADGTTTYAKWASDDNEALLDEDIITLGTIWRWKMTHNLAYDEDFRQYEIRKNNAMTRDGGKIIKSLAGGRLYDKPFYPGLPEGNWNV